MNNIADVVTKQDIINNIMTTKQLKTIKNDDNIKFLEVKKFKTTIETLQTYSEHTKFLKSEYAEKDKETLTITDSINNLLNDIDNVIIDNESEFILILLKLQNQAKTKIKGYIELNKKSFTLITEYLAESNIIIEGTPIPNDDILDNNVSVSEIETSKNDVNKLVTKANKQVTSINSSNSEIENIKVEADLKDIIDLEEETKDLKLSGTENKELINNNINTMGIQIEKFNTLILNMAKKQFDKLLERSQVILAKVNDLDDTMNENITIVNNTSETALNSTSHMEIFNSKNKILNKLTKLKQKKNTLDNFKKNIENNIENINLLYNASNTIQDELSTSYTAVIANIKEILNTTTKTYELQQSNEENVNKIIDNLSIHLSSNVKEKIINTVNETEPLYQQIVEKLIVSNKSKTIFLENFNDETIPSEETILYLEPTYIELNDEESINIKNTITNESDFNRILYTYKKFFISYNTIKNCRDIISNNSIEISANDNFINELKKYLLDSDKQTIIQGIVKVSDYVGKSNDQYSKSINNYIQSQKYLNFSSELLLKKAEDLVQLNINYINTKEIENNKLYETGKKSLEVAYISSETDISIEDNVVSVVSQENALESQNTLIDLDNEMEMNIDDMEKYYNNFTYILSSDSRLLELKARNNQNYLDIEDKIADSNKLLDTLEDYQIKVQRYIKLTIANIRTISEKEIDNKTDIMADSYEILSTAYDNIISNMNELKEFESITLTEISQNTLSLVYNLALKKKAVVLVKFKRIDANFIIIKNANSAIHKLKTTAILEDILDNLEVIDQQYMDSNIKNLDAISQKDNVLDIVDKHKTSILELTKDLIIAEYNKSENNNYEINTLFQNSNIAYTESEISDSNIQIVNGVISQDALIKAQNALEFIKENKITIKNFKNDIIESKKKN